MRPAAERCLSTPSSSSLLVLAGSRGRAALRRPAHSFPASPPPPPVPPLFPPSNAAAATAGSAVAIGTGSTGTGGATAAGTGIAGHEGPSVEAPQPQQRGWARAKRASVGDGCVCEHHALCHSISAHQLATMLSTLRDAPPLPPPCASPPPPPPRPSPRTIVLPSPDPVLTQSCPVLLFFRYSLSLCPSCMNPKTSHKNQIVRT